MTAPNLNKLKTIDTRTKSLVFGYVHEAEHAISDDRIIPVDIIHLCLLFYVHASDGSFCCVRYVPRWLQGTQRLHFVFKRGYSEHQRSKLDATLTDSYFLLQKLSHRFDLKHPSFIRVSIYGFAGSQYFYAISPFMNAHAFESVIVEL